MDHYAALKSEQQHQIINALLDWYDPGTFDEGALWTMSVDELKDLHTYESMIEHFEEGVKQMAKYYIEYLDKSLLEKDRETIIVAATGRDAVNILYNRGDCSAVLSVVDITKGEEDWVNVTEDSIV